MSDQADERGLAAADDIPIAEYPSITSVVSSARDRRTVLKAGVAAVAGAGAYALLNVFPHARPAFAAPPPYLESDIYNPYFNGPGACGSDQGCTGPPPDLIDNYYCTTCAEYRRDPTANWFNYYLNGRRGSAVFYDMDPNICRSSRGPVDVWIHPQVVPCGSCPTQLDLRCQDGYKDPDSEVGPTFCICHSIHRCEGRLTGKAC